MGDGTTSVVVLAGELLREAEQLVAQKVHPMTIIAGRWTSAWDTKHGQVRQSSHACWGLATMAGDGAAARRGDIWQWHVGAWNGSSVPVFMSTAVTMIVSGCGNEWLLPQGVSAGS